MKNCTIFFKHNTFPNDNHNNYQQVTTALIPLTNSSDWTVVLPPTQKYHDCF